MKRKDILKLFDLFIAIFNQRAFLIYCIVTV